MDSQITFPPKAINLIANVMATQNSADPNWVTSKSPCLNY